MYYRIRDVLVVVITAWAAAAAAQDLKTMQNLNQVVRTGLVQFRVIAGRVSLDCSRVNNYQTANNFDKQQDSLSIQSDDGDAGLIIQLVERQAATIHRGFQRLESSHSI